MRAESSSEREEEQQRGAWTAVKIFVQSATIIGTALMFLWKEKTQSQALGCKTQIALTQGIRQFSNRHHNRKGAVLVTEIDLH